MISPLIRFTPWAQPLYRELRQLPLDTSFTRSQFYRSSWTSGLCSPAISHPTYHKWNSFCSSPNFISSQYSGEWPPNNCNFPGLKPEIPLFLLCRVICPVCNIMAGFCSGFPLWNSSWPFSVSPSGLMSLGGLDDHTDCSLSLAHFHWRSRASLLSSLSLPHDLISWRILTGWLHSVLTQLCVSVGVHPEEKGTC